MKEIHHIIGIKMKNTKEEFIETWNKYNSPKKVSEELGVDIRNVYRRRERLEKEGYILPSSTESKTNRTAYLQKISINIDDGIAIIASDRHKWPGDGITPAESVLHTVIKKLNPDIFIMNGDLFDGASLSNHMPLGWEEKPSVLEEITGCQEVMNNIESLLREDAIKIMTVGNHCRRFDYRLAKLAPEYRDLPGTRLSDYFPNWMETWTVHINEGVMGGHTVVKHKFKGGPSAARNNALSSGVTIVTGHTHALNCVGVQDYSGRRWGVECGYLSYKNHPSFEYAEGAPSASRPGFAVLTWRSGILQPPELVELDDSNVAWFRGEPVYAEKPRIKVKARYEDKN